MSRESFTRVIFDDPNYDKECNLVALSGSRVVGFAGGAASADDSKQKEESHVKLIAVSPEMRRRGVGTELLGRLVGHFRSRGKSVVRVVRYPSGGRYFFPGVPFEYEDSLGFFRENGFERDQVIQDVSLDLDRYEPHPSVSERREGLAADGIRVVPFERGMLPEMRRFVERADMPNWFQAGWDAKLRAATEDIRHLVARREDGEILGTTRCGLGSHEEGDSWFGMIVVLPEHRNRGIGRVLLHEACRLLKGKGCRTVRAGWARVPFYLANGWRVSREYHALQKRI